MFVGIIHELFNFWKSVSVSSYLIHFSFFTQSLFCFVFSFFFLSLFYFCLVCAVAIMGSKPQMSMALPCSALREEHWNTEATTIQLAQQGATGQAPQGGCTPRGQAKGDVYPKHFSVDQDKIFILLPRHCTRTATPLPCRSSVPKINSNSVLSWLAQLWGDACINIKKNNNQKNSAAWWCDWCRSKWRFCLSWTPPPPRDSGKFWMLCTSCSGSGRCWWLLGSAFTFVGIFPCLQGTGCPHVSVLPAARLAKSAFE